ncbi:MAG: hypothetical protein IJW14_03080 [Oscillospiraceae bacterium]|nr:hypothetical protein [Oscillospiraceae bacterium]
MKKKISLLCALALMLWLTGCFRSGSDDTTAPTEPPYKTVYVHSSITQEFGSSVSRTEYLFDQNDQVQEVVVYTNDVETKRHSVECDENGNYIRWISDGSVMEYTYDKDGHNLGMSMYIGGVLVSSTRYTWENGLRTSATTQMAAQNMTQRVQMIYDSHGHLLRQDSYTADTLSSYCIYVSDENGRVQAMTAYQPDGTFLSLSAHSWSGTTQTITTTDPDGKLIQTAVMTYDEHGNLLTHQVRNADGELVSKETHTWKAVQVDPDCPRASV